jgi:DNA-binding response OmpR family regulator
MGNVLVVDDELDICILLTKQLKKLGFQTSSCQSIQEARIKISTSSFDLYFVDLNLADGSGYDLIETIRDVDQKTKIIVISAFEGERQKILQAGASLFVPKPFTNEMIRQALLNLNVLQNTVTK